MPNACTGGIDFGVIDTPQLVLTKASNPNGGYANVGAYANADIGDSSSGCQIDVCAVVYNNIDIQSFDIHKPF